MGVDVASLLAQYEDAPNSEPMHGQSGEIRRNPSTDQRKVRRQQMTQKKKAVADVSTIAELRQQAALAPTLAQQAALIEQAEALESDRRMVTSAERALDLTVKEAVEIVPHGGHELHTAATDWITAEAARSFGDQNEATQELVAQASLWFARVPEFVKADPEEFATQAVNKARREASRFGEHAEVAGQAFCTEAARLHRQAVKAGLQLVDQLPEGDEEDAAPAHEASLARTASVEMGKDEPDAFAEEGRKKPPEKGPGRHRFIPTDPDVRRAIDTNPGTGHEPRHNAPDIGVPKIGPDPERPNPPYYPWIRHEWEKAKHGEDVAGLREQSEGYARWLISPESSLNHQKIARLRGEDDEVAELGAVLAGFAIPEVAEAAEGGSGSGLGEIPGIGGGGHGGDTLGRMFDSGTNQLAGDTRAADDAQLSSTGASAVPQVGAYGPGGTDGFPTSTFPSFAPQTAGEPVDTTSNRSPALQEIQNFTGWDGTSVVPTGGDPEAPDASGANKLNGDQPYEDASSGDALSTEFPVGSAYASLARTATIQKESDMTEHRECPTCGGFGKVAVRKQAYSGLPQIDQIVNADETPGTEPAPGQVESYPTQVAFPLTGWGSNPAQGPQNVQQKIEEVEQQIASRPQGRPGAPGPGGPGGSVAASLHEANKYIKQQGGKWVITQKGTGKVLSHHDSEEEAEAAFRAMEWHKHQSLQRAANGRDNSGWAGDMGARGVDYPGYSTPVGYDGSSNLGQPDPVYGFGGDQPNAPHLPYGAMEADDITNDPGQPWDPASAHNNDQGQSTVSPTMGTGGFASQGSHPDPFIASAQEEILRQQQLIRERTAQLHRRAG